MNKRNREQRGQPRLCHCAAPIWRLFSWWGCLCAVGIATTATMLAHVWWGPLRPLWRLVAWAHSGSVTIAPVAIFGFSELFVCVFLFLYILCWAIFTPAFSLSRKEREFTEPSEGRGFVRGLFCCALQVQRQWRQLLWQMLFWWSCAAAVDRGRAGAACESLTSAAAETMKEDTTLHRTSPTNQVLEPTERY